MSLSLLLGITEFCYAFLRQCTYRISRVWVSVRVRASLRLAALVYTCLYL